MSRMAYLKTRSFEGHTRDKVFRKIIKKICSLEPPRECPPLWDESRIRYGEDEYFTEYGFLPQGLSNLSDDEINEFIEEEMWERTCSPYDCSGQRFTMWIDWHRNPCGRISYVHELGIDV